MKETAIIITLLLSFSLAFGQETGTDRDSLIQFSGLVIEDDSLRSTPVPGVAVYVPGTGRGSITNTKGFFTMPVISGDSIVVKGLGYSSQQFIIPDSAAGSFSMKIRLAPDTLELPAFRLPYATVQEFKQAFLALELPEDKKEDFAMNNLDPEILMSMQLNAEASPSMNFRYLMQANAAHHEQKYTMTTIPFLNPTKLAEFIDYILNKRKRDKEKEIRQKIEEEKLNID